ncbi:MAG TPA: hypothetical protein VFL27_08715 [Candidatus Dormibacteraeota bacterium]|nr:hypothetical protein [Candidatus Dormibacteraeota bacterium]
MSETDDDLELAALQRQLDDAFQTTRPRAGFDDELWLRMQSRRPAPRRLGDALAGLMAGIRAVPIVPAGAIALILVLAFGVGLLARFSPRGGGGASTASQYAPAPNDQNAGAFGKVPTPAFGTGGKSAATPLTQQSAAGGSAGVQYVWTGKLNLGGTPAPVFRYNEPTSNAADQFATALGAVLSERPPGLLGKYSASDYTLTVQGTVQSPASSPAYFILSAADMPAIEAAGAGPADVATIFLAQHSLVPQWPYTTEVETSGDLVKVRYERQFTAGAYGPAYLVDVNGQRYGLEVDLSGNRPVLVSGLLPVNVDQANYTIISADDAVRAALAAGSPGGPKVTLDHAELVYVLVPAGDHSFYEPAILFTGSQTLNGQAVPRRVLVPAVDPSQRNP